MKDAAKNEAMRAKTIEAVKSLNEDNKEKSHLLACQVLDTYVSDADFDEGDLDVLDVIVQLFEVCDDYARVLTSVRHQARILGWGPYALGERYFRALYSSNSKAEFKDFCMLNMPGDIGKTIMIACIPKSGSTFLHSVLMEATGYPGPKLCLSYANEENMLSPEFIRSIYGVNKIAQEHCRALPHNLAIMQAYNMDIVVLVRNIFDSLVSLRDMLLSETKGSRMAFFQDNLPAMSEEQQLDAVITRWAHWQLDFYVSWVMAFRENRVRGTIWTYENLMADKPAAVQKILQQVNHEISFEKAQEAVASVEGDKVRSRLNVGVSGRGRELMNERQIESIQSMTKFYPGIDFSPLGL
ncbi:MAG: hypothetical protein HON65_15410 [Rhodospirillales bacterium]|jgi:hypothetical protein|nr:hypothetical protein [Rhodospirillales bacterium]